MAEESQAARRLEIATAILLSTAGLLSAWASYQAALWGGVQASHYARASAKVTEASRLSIVDGQAVGSDSMLFMAWLDAAADNDVRRMNFYEHRFSPEMRAVFAPWRARFPGDLRKHEIDPDAPDQFLRPRHREGQAAIVLQRAADTEFAEGDTANGIGDRYVATTVVLSVVLFLGGISPLLKNDRVRLGLLALAALIGVAAAIAIFRLPVESL